MQAQEHHTSSHVGMNIHQFSLLPGAGAGDGAETRSAKKATLSPKFQYLALQTTDMPPKHTSTGTPNIHQPSIPALPRRTPLSRQKQAPISWEKNGPDGTSSIYIILEWLAVDGNYQRWQGDNKGATKSTLAVGILAEIVDSSITHQDTKGIQTKIQELQASYTKASNFLRGIGSGILDKDVQDGSTNLLDVPLLGCLTSYYGCSNLCQSSSDERVNESLNPRPAQ
ncbi:uncharacterized protein VP01_1328g3 [Puccinia sorghi]|uniref:Uncharacterized protein n=1 Tax=Puccinia sorghi TaxID=27349 RepID=A0A0L6VMJ7_9BASI|nr:uncharacterized protein VP01_1328g3 [Puccinia sorghi]